MTPDIKHGERLLVRMVALIAAILVFAVLHVTSWVTSTLALAFFVTVAVWPVDSFLRRRLPGRLRWIGHLAALALVILLFSLFLGGVFLAASQIMAGLPAYEDVIAQTLQQASERVGFPQMADEAQSMGSGRLFERLMGMVTGVVRSTSNLAGILSLIFFLVLLMLVETPVWAGKLKSITGRRDGETFRSAMDAIATRIRWYFAVRTLMGLATGILYALWSWAWNLDFVFVWGLLAFLLSYVPNVGSLVAGVLAAAFAFLQLDPFPAGLYGFGLLLIEQVMGNYADPKLQGRELSLSPLVILVALMLWSWVWGIAGTLVAVPMTLVIMIVFARVPALRSFALFLSNHRDVDELMRSVDA
ncbi:AI-2E family transporter [Zhengella sp. ZM62]|uniref:AI-2E family transporter n=1 Tax=Zhengella sedimenti TaxID=3390035 RepID=UPI0039753B15